MKYCPKCRRDLPISQYAKNKTKPDGLAYWCRDCNNASSRKYHATHKEQRKETRRAWYLRNRDKIKLREQTLERQYKIKGNMARHRSISFTLTPGEFEQLWQQPCSYCGDEILTVGIDRIDSSKGYSQDNCVPCCKRCNAMKSDMSIGEFLYAIRKIYDHITGQGQDSNDIELSPDLQEAN
jgi:5-methylcytosine-specific restriction endonuclease McrA